MAVRVNNGTGARAADMGSGFIDKLIAYAAALNNPASH
jgi:hypothetical protein